MNFDSFFPTIIANDKFEKHIDIEQELSEYCINLQNNIESGGKSWVSNKTYNTSDGKHEIYFDKKFKLLNDWVVEKIKNYCEYLEIDNSNIVNNGSWFNIYKKYDYQEKHVHPTSIISSIYILTSSDDSAKIFFNSPITEMFYIKNKKQKIENISQISCKSIAGTLIIFPSYLPHSVERHDSDITRITLSYNFKQIN